MAIKFGIHTGSGCNFDETVVLYARDSLQRVARINAQPLYEHGYDLRDLDAGKDDQAGARIIAYGWVGSNCTSNWNGNLFRVDLAQAASVESILTKDASAFGGEQVEVTVAGDTVTFTYVTDMRHSDSNTRSAVSRYLVQDHELIREAPLADSFGGFIEEWLGLDDREAGRGSTPEAAARHHDLTVSCKKDNFIGEHAADCAAFSHQRVDSFRNEDGSCLR